MRKLLEVAYELEGSLPARGARIEIFAKSIGCCFIARRSPQGERGLKLRFYPRYRDSAGRSPQGERGLKWL